MLRQEPMQLLIHNLSLQQELEEQGVFLGSKGERLWLQEQLASLEARALLGEDAKQLRNLLGCEEIEDPEAVSWWPLLRQAQEERQGVELFWTDNQGQRKNGAGWPLALEYYCCRGEWYVHWWSEPPYDCYSKIPWRQIEMAVLNGQPMSGQVQKEAEKLGSEQLLQARVRLPAAYESEHWRLLCSLTRFDKEVRRNEDGSLEVQLGYLPDDYAYLRMRLRELGLRVEVLEPELLRRELQDEAVRALARYK